MERILLYHVKDLCAIVLLYFLIYFSLHLKTLHVTNKFYNNIMTTC